MMQRIKTMSEGCNTIYLYQAFLARGWPHPKVERPSDEIVARRSFAERRSSR